MRSSFILQKQAAAHASQLKSSSLNKFGVSGACRSGLLCTWGEVWRRVCDLLLATHYLHAFQPKTQVISCMNTPVKARGSLIKSSTVLVFYRILVSYSDSMFKLSSKWSCSQQRAVWPSSHFEQDSRTLSWSVRLSTHHPNISLVPEGLLTWAVSISLLTLISVASNIQIRFPYIWQPVVRCSGSLTSVTGTSSRRK